MSAFIVKRKSDNGGYSIRDYICYEVVRQDEKLRNHREDSVSYGKFELWTFVSAGYPTVDNGIKQVWMRGRSECNDNMPLRVYPQLDDSFKRAVLAFNIAKGNNKHLEMEDVIL